MIGVYKTPLVEVTTRGIYTNTTPVGAYRGAGRPEIALNLERLVDAAAAHALDDAAGEREPVRQIAAVAVAPGVDAAGGERAQQMVAVNLDHPVVAHVMIISTLMRI